MTQPQASAITQPPKHHLFGFHDLVAFNADNSRMLCLQVDRIDHPPLDGQPAAAGFVTVADRVFHPVADITAFNYPQGARQQWVAGTNFFCVNDRSGATADRWIARFFDTDTGKQTAEMPYAIHCLTRDGRTGFGINYARLYRLGGYGYIGVPDPYADDPAPAADGLFRIDVQTGSVELLCSIADIAACKANSPVSPTGHHHYITHPVLSPSDRRIAFLHRYRLPDGGEMTRLMSVGVNGNDLRCLAAGGLSHFDWMDDQRIMIWGRAGSGVDKLRGNPLMANPLVKGLLKPAKRLVKRALGKSAAMQASFLAVTDADDPQITPVAQGVLTCDGHPMRCPVDNDWFVNDTYPDANGIRTLMLYQVSANRRIDLGTFKMLDVKPDMQISHSAMQTLFAMVRRDFPEDLFAFTRSGLHCDLHPRWDALGKTVAFDSIHEGTRQVYTLDVSRWTGR